jgi:LmbE family N-acetylglucosaminyl deacetylase
MIFPASLGAPHAPLKLLCLGAHCDDIEVGCGGTVLRLLSEHPGSSVYWLVVSSNKERALEAKASADDFLAQAGHADVEIKQFRDGYFPHEWASIKDAFEATKALFRPDLILTHHRGDRHQDHNIVAELTWNTFRDHLILEYEIPKYEGDLGTPNLFVPLSDSIAKRKLDLLARHFPSQHAKSWYKAPTFEAVLRLRGVECNAPAGLAEAFHASKLVI